MPNKWARGDGGDKRDRDFLSKLNLRDRNTSITIRFHHPILDGVTVMLHISHNVGASIRFSAASMTSLVQRASKNFVETRYLAYYWLFPNSSR